MPPERSDIVKSEQSEYHYDGMDFKKGLLENTTLWIHLSPMAHAITGTNGIAIANPISEVIVGKNKHVSIAYNPEATAIAGPGGIAHAESDLNLYEYTKSL